jgi:hypothetical protein
LIQTWQESTLLGPSNILGRFEQSNLSVFYSMTQAPRYKDTRQHCDLPGFSRVGSWLSHTKQMKTQKQGYTA